MIKLFRDEQLKISWIAQIFQAFIENKISIDKTSVDNQDNTRVSSLGTKKNTKSIVRQNLDWKLPIIVDNSHISRLAKYDFCMHHTIGETMSDQIRLFHMRRIIKRWKNESKIWRCTRDLHFRYIYLLIDRKSFY